MNSNTTIRDYYYTCTHAHTYAHITYIVSSAEPCFAIQM